jgi:hypothetical protein
MSLLSTSIQNKGPVCLRPNRRVRRLRESLLDEGQRRINLPEYHYHCTSGGHLAALHRHLDNKFFCRIDIQSFYAIGRNRVAGALRHFSITNPRDRTRWSCVFESLHQRGYVLPIGFVQSPVRASLVVLRAPVADAIDRTLKRGPDHPHLQRRGCDRSQQKTLILLEYLRSDEPRKKRRHDIFTKRNSILPDIVFDFNGEPTPACGELLRLNSQDFIGYCGIGRPKKSNQRQRRIRLYRPDLIKRNDFRPGNDLQLNYLAID